MINYFFQNNIISAYIEWHFFDVPREILKGWKNFLKFNLDYFSLILLLKTFFSPWHKYKYSYGKGFNPWRYFEVFVFNTMSRTIGAFLRVLVIILGILLEIFIFILGLLFLSTWVILPFLMLITFFYGIYLLF